MIKKLVNVTKYLVNPLPLTQQLSINFEDATIKKSLYCNDAETLTITIDDKEMLFKTTPEALKFLSQFIEFQGEVKDAEGLL